MFDHLLNTVFDVFVCGIVTDIVLQPERPETFVAGFKRKQVCITKLKLLGDFHAFRLPHDHSPATFDDHKDVGSIS
jgi:hypothetical protein